MRASKFFVFQICLTEKCKPFDRDFVGGTPTSGSGEKFAFDFQSEAFFIAPFGIYALSILWCQNQNTWFFERNCFQRSTVSGWELNERNQACHYGAHWAQKPTKVKFETFFPNFALSTFRCKDYNWCQNLIVLYQCKIINWGFSQKNQESTGGFGENCVYISS